MPDDDRLRLIALDTEDLAVLSAHVQDAVLKLQDVKWLPREKRFVAAMNRFVWEMTAGKPRARVHQRRRTALSFARVDGVKSIGVDLKAPATVLSLLAIRFEGDGEGDGPSGDIVLEFAGGASIRLAVECVEAQLSDLGPAWSTLHAPRHSLK
jgi:hypothetical protein